MSTVQSLLDGFMACLTPMNMFASILGVIMGTLTGVLPGLGITGAIALLLPVSYGMEPLTAIIMFGGIFYGAMYGGSTTSILINVPGEGASVITCLEGYEMAKRGRAGAALSIAAIGSFIAGTIGIIGLTFFAPALASAALAFGPPEYFAISALGLIILSNISGKSVLRASLMALVGVMLGTVGIDPMSGISRFTLGVTDLLRGFDFVILIMGVYGIGEVLATVFEKDKPVEIEKVKFRELYPNKEEAKRSAAPILRGGVLGFFLGLIPGPSATISTFVSYAMEKKLSKRKEEWGKGAIEGVAGPESANNSASVAQMIPLLSLGIPFSASTAMLLGGFMIHGISPGPMLVTTHPTIFWGLIASLYIGNIFLLVLNLPFVGVFASLLKVPIKILMPIIVIVVFTGGYAINNSLFDLYILLLFGILGYFMKLADFDLTPMAIGIFLGPSIETGLVQGMTISDGSFLTLLNRPLAGGLIKISLAIMLFGMFKGIIIKAISKRKAKAAI